MKYEWSKQSKKSIKQEKKNFEKGLIQAVENQMDELNSCRGSTRRFKRITPTLYKLLSSRVLKENKDIFLVGDIGQHNSETVSSGELSK